METRTREKRRSEESETSEDEWTKWWRTSHLAGSSSPDRFVGKSSLPSSLAYSEVSHHSFAAQPRSIRSLARPHPEPQPLRPRPSSLRTQDVSHLLARVFRNLYSVEVIGEEVSANLIEARGSENARHEEFVDQLQQVTVPAAPRGGIASADGAETRDLPAGPGAGSVSALAGAGHCSNSLLQWIRQCSRWTLHKYADTHK